MPYCNYCGEIHGKKDACCVANQTTTMSTRSATAAAKLAAQSGARDEVGDLATSFTSLSVEQKEKQTKEAIEQVEAEIRLAELESRLQLLKEERDKVRGRTAMATKGAVPDGRVSTPAPPLGFRQEEEDGGPELRLPPPTWEDEHHRREGFSDYGRSRRRSRDCHRHRSRSRSDSSETRRRRSKWLLKHHTVGGKDVRKLNAYELIAASSLWCLEIQNLTVADYKAFIEHICLIAIRAKDDYYKDSAHVDYVLAVRRAAEKLGFRAFSKEFSGDSVVHYGPQNMKQRRSTYSTYGKKRSPGSQSKRPCYSWNSDSGCFRTEDECRYNHSCAKCD